MEQTVQGLLNRPHSMQIGNITYDIFRHPQRDPGCWNEAEAFLRSQARQYRYAMVLFDHHGSGQEDRSVGELQSELEERLSKTGWDDRACVVILNPELEIWIWSDSPQVDECLGWQGHQPDLRTWLRGRGLLASDALKPDDPKLALEEALKVVNKRRSAVIYRQLSERVSVNRCTDPGFQRFRSNLSMWFYSG